MRSLKDIVIVLCAVTGLVMLTTLPATAQAIARAYTTDTTLQRGMIVRLSEKDKNKVETVTSKDAEKIEGVVVAANESPVTLSDSDQSKQQVFVATTGRYDVLVSDQNGTITAGSYITVSSLDGIGMKAGGSDKEVIGKAVTGFDGRTNVISTTTIKGLAGTTKTLALGLVAIDISIARNPKLTVPKSSLPGFEVAQSAATSLTGKQVSPARIYMSCLLILLTAVIAGTILYAGIRNGILAVGRNPLAKSSITRNLIPVVLTGIIILILGIIGVYLLLKL